MERNLDVDSHVGYMMYTFKVDIFVLCLFWHSVALQA